MLGFSASTNAFIRHIYSFLAGIGFAATLLGIDADTWNQVVTALHQIGDGVMSIGLGVTALVPIVAGLYARWTAKPAQVAAAAAQTDGLKVVPTTLAGAKILAAMPEKAKEANQ